MKISRTINSMFLLFSVALLLFVSWAVFANSSCANGKCEVYKENVLVKLSIEDGYTEQSIIRIKGFEYLSLTNKDNLNNCSKVFLAKSFDLVQAVQSGKDQICNFKYENDKVLSSWRDAGAWNESVYSINQNGQFDFLYNDSCIGCGEIKRTYANNETAILGDAAKFDKRNALNGVITVQKATLYNVPDFDKPSRSYLIKGDVITLIDRTRDGNFYRVEYHSRKKTSRWWISEKDFDLKDLEKKPNAGTGTRPEN